MGKSEEQSLTDIAYACIKERIVNLTYPPGSYLTEAALAGDLGMSRMPVRTAVKDLQKEGLILGGYRKKMRVKEITQRDIRELYQIRELLEEGALRQIFAAGQAREYSFRLEEKLVRMRAEAADTLAWERADALMHAELLTIYDNDRIVKIYQMNQDEIIRIGILSSNLKPEIEAVNEEIQELVQALRAEDYKAACRILLTEHLGESKNRALKRIRDNHTDGKSPSQL